MALSSLDPEEEEKVADLVRQHLDRKACLIEAPAFAGGLVGKILGALTRLVLCQRELAGQKPGRQRYAGDGAVSGLRVRIFFYFRETMAGALYSVPYRGKGSRLMVENANLVSTTPGRLSLNQFGKRMKWGSDSSAARAQIPHLTRSRLRDAGVTTDMAYWWAQFYRKEMQRVPDNPSASGRADLMERAWKLLQ